MELKLEVEEEEEDMELSRDLLDVLNVSLDHMHLPLHSYLHCPLYLCAVECHMNDKVTESAALTV